ncbi:hypothetical protein Poli38472_006837 [Pythium oligandrum]|uniref:Uncharacterized protein n=1 Tax=Pythium oligandrum TaxID=41045 RepID=A0A8K1C5D3_PYTOL|nr:hypothetical protein Poli38472_006837 [Pythium oligandrum]|eukprot:TMW56827.1 hypothetical protein Poli38472_006837 [Pythium oligandrum]
MEFAQEAYVSICATPEFAKVSVEELRWQQKFVLFHPDWRRRLDARSLMEQHVQRYMGEIVLDRPRWWIEFEAKETKRNEWVDTIAVSVTQKMLHEAVGGLVARLYPVATCIFKQYDAVKANGAEKKLSELLGTWPMDIDASHGPYQVIADHCLRDICREDVMAWPDGWGSCSCVCSRLQDLIEEATTRCVRVIQHVEAIPALKTCINEVHLDTDRTRQYVGASLELLIAKYKLQLAPVIAPGPLSNLFIMDNPELLVASHLGDLQVGALPRQLELEIDADGIVTQISSFDGQVAKSGCLSTALNSLVALFNQSLACLAAYPPLAKGNDSRFTHSLPKAEELFPVEAAAPFTLNGTSCRVSVRLICSKVIDNGDTNAVWHDATLYSDYDDNVLATGFVFLHVDNLVGPRVRYHGELLYADTHDLLRD